MNRYDYYTRCVNFDEQEWLTEELYYPEPEEASDRNRYVPHSCTEYTNDFDDYYFYCLYDNEDEEIEYWDEDWEVKEDEAMECWDEDWEVNEDEAMECWDEDWEDDETAVATQDGIESP